MIRMNEFDAYKMYLSFKLHFTTDKYDIKQTQGAVSVTKDTFMKRKDAFAFKRIAKDMNENDFAQFLIANFVAGNSWGGVYTNQSQENFAEWKKRLQSLTYRFKDELSKISIRLAEDNLDFDKVFIPDDGSHPILLQMFFANEVSPETMVILNKLTAYVKLWDMKLKHDPFWEDRRRLIIKYSQFLNFEKNKMREIFNQIKEDHYILVKEK
jgi:hypothetical protein